MEEVHRSLAVSCFNECWTLIDKPDRTADETETMVLLAAASLWHWTRRADCQPLNLAVGYWQVSRVHALAGQTQAARWYGHRSLEVSRQAALPPFYLGYAYEALARAEIADHATAPAAALLTEAYTALARVADDEEKQLLQRDLEDLTKQIDQAQDEARP
jgi:hypothetical protein